ncbi:ATP synthase F1, delta subunit [Fusobacterium equinum]|uniref:ATP synthase subunit delta n=1 Tax=Fusobacterium equinum TaxID=134605 RepID=A0A133NBH2_9FUSO|nr:MULTISPECIES: ATP synthase F1 subunit delta [Fusobacterium]KXA13644.1 ATP synthase F1, delta subunit [Fusobacterium equinum]
MIENQVGRRYAEAIYTIAEERGKVKETHTFLNSIMELYKNDITFRNFIQHPLLKVQEKEEVLREIFAEVSDELLQIAFYILEKGRISFIRNIVAEYLKIYYEKHQILDVVATFAVELSEEQKAKLIQKLKDKTKHEIRLETQVDESILGGGILKIGDQVMDGSLRKELQQIKNGKKS